MRIGCIITASLGTVQTFREIPKPVFAWRDHLDLFTCGLLRMGLSDFAMGYTFLLLRPPRPILPSIAGRTLAGWQPYGYGAANFYATQDWDGNVHTVASQIVLQTGANRVTIAHELLHAYQMRDAPAGSYGQALLTEEMGAFMAATGWVQIVSDEELQAAVHGSWDEIAALFRYDGADLGYVSETGETLEAFAPNPI